MKKIIERISAFIEKNQLSGVIVGFVSFFLIFLFSLTEIYTIFELKLFDLRFKLKPGMPVWEQLSFADIDEHSIDHIGLYPWTRDIYAKGLNTLARIGAGQVNLDILFPDASPNQLDMEDAREIEKRAGRGEKITAGELKKIIRNNDMLLAKSIAEANRVIITYEFTRKIMTGDVLEKRESGEFKSAQKRFTELASVRVAPDRAEEMGSLRDPHVTGISYPIPPLMRAARSFGFSDRDTDVDGGFRKIRLVLEYQGRIYFNLALSMLMDICRVTKDRIEIVPGKRIVLKKAFNPVTHEMRDISIPIDDRGMMLVNWAESAGRDYKRETTFNSLPFHTLLFYDKWRGDVHKYFDEAGESGGNVKIADLNGRIEEAQKRYARAADVQARKAEWDRISGMKKEIAQIKKGYVKAYADSIRQAESDMAGEKDPAAKKKLKNELSLMKDDLTAMEQVMRVEDLKDHIIISGLTATGTIDIGVTPLNTEYPRVGIYHNTINTILHERHIHRTGKWVNYAIMLIVALAIGFFAQKTNARRSIMLIAGAFIASTAAMLFLFIFAEIWVDQLGITMAVLLPSLTLTSIKFMKEESQKRFIKSAFSYYLSPSVIEEIIKDPDSLELGGEDREITIFFSDIKSFSSISEKLTAQALVKRLNEYLTEMTDIILKYNGTVDKYIGDAIMAFYGAPIAMKDHPLKACMAAIEMKKRLRELQEKWRKAGLDELHARIGLNSGKATVGNMGSETRMDYTAMGDAVNLASRLEGANKFFGTSAMMSGATYEGVKNNIDARHLGVIRVVGKAESVSIYELMGVKGSLPDKIYDMLEKYDQGRECFLRQDWKEARLMFRQGLKIVPDDGPCGEYIDLCDAYMKNPPKRGWDGVFVLKGK